MVGSISAVRHRNREQQSTSDCCSCSKFMSIESNKSVSILGVPLGYGASMAGVDMGPAALRVARLNQRIARLGYSVRRSRRFATRTPADRFRKKMKNSNMFARSATPANSWPLKLKRYSKPGSTFRSYSAAITRSRSDRLPVSPLTTKNRTRHSV